MKKLALSIITAAYLTVGAAVLTAGAEDEKIAPKTVIHVVTVSWKADASEEQIQAALDGVKQLAKEFDGIKRVWTKTVSAQGNRSHAFVMEFASQEALVKYAGSDAQKKWYEVYMPVRDGSTTFDISN